MQENQKYNWPVDLKENRGGFQIPQNYLEDFDNRLMQKISIDARPKKTKVISYKKWAAILFPFAAILLLGYLLIDQTSKSGSEYMYSEISWDEYAGFDETWITEELASLDFEDESQMDAEINFLLDDGITTSEILDVYRQEP